MGSWLSYIKDRIIPSILSELFSVILSSAVLSSVLSKITTGDWLELFNRAISGDWSAILVLLVLLLGVGYIIKKIREPKITGPPPIIAVGTIPLFGYDYLGTLEYAGVLWRVRAPRSYYSRPSPSSVEVEPIPRCPKCQTELEESKRRFFPGYTWKCVKCGFTKNNRDSFYQESDRAERIAKSEIERLIREGQNDTLA